MIAQKHMDPIRRIRIRNTAFHHNFYMYFRRLLGGSIRTEIYFFQGRRTHHGDRVGGLQDWQLCGVWLVRSAFNPGKCHVRIACFSRQNFDTDKRKPAEPVSENCVRDKVGNKGCATLLGFVPQSTVHYIPRVPQCMSPRWNWEPPPPPLQEASLPIPPEPGGVAHSPACEGVGESQFRWLEKNLCTLTTTCFKHRPRVHLRLKHPSLFIFYITIIRFSQKINRRC